MNRYNLNYCIL